MEEEKGTFIYICEKCGYIRRGTLDHDMYSTNCPECNGGYVKYDISEKVKE